MKTGHDPFPDVCYISSEGRSIIMKKIKAVSLVLMLLVCAAVLCACVSNEDNSSKATEVPNVTAVPNMTAAPQAPAVTVTGDWKLSLADYGKLLGEETPAMQGTDVYYSFYEDGTYCMQVPALGKEAAYDQYTVSGNYITLCTPGEDLGPFYCIAQYGNLYLYTADGASYVALTPAR